MFHICLCDDIINQKLEAISKDSVQLLANGKHSQWKDLLDDHVTIMSMGKTYNGKKGVDTYIKDLNIQSSTITLTTPINANDYYSTFAKKLEGGFKNGCLFSVPNIVQLIHFNNKLKIDKWVEHFPSNFDEMRFCQKTEL